VSIHSASNFSGKPAERPFRKRAMRGLIGILLAAGLLGAAPAASQANAYGYQYWRRRGRGVSRSSRQASSSTASRATGASSPQMAPTTSRAEPYATRR